MSTENGGNFPSLGSRLRDERKRLGLSQAALCEKIGVKDPKTLRNWESGTTSPTLDDVVGFVGSGFDIGYVLTGVRSDTLMEMSGRPYGTPAVMLAETIAAMTLSKDDAEMILALARRLSLRR
ncbi:MAG: helix-turn-helix transcriptional regulator [Pseudomonadota bacterium]